MTLSAEAFAKISITLMLIRITTSRRWTWFFYSLIVLFVLVTIVTLFSDVFQCVPLAKLWDPMLVRTGTCNRVSEISTAYLQGSERFPFSEHSWITKNRPRLTIPAVSAALYDIILATFPYYARYTQQELYR